MEKAHYAEDRVRLEEGDVLVLYSDGLVETLDPPGDQFGWDRLIVLLENLAPEASANEIRDLILRELWDFKGDADQVDDVTMVVIRVRPAAAVDSTAGQRPE
jgi:sigma-B regulation protein RsbU (phosphoserine phosphatase)